MIHGNQAEIICTDLREKLYFANVLTTQIL